jgi:hypothetical protein
MAESPDDSAGDGKKTEAEAAQERAINNLPMVLAPKLGAGEDEPIEEPDDASADAAAASAAQVHSTRYLMLAGTVAFAAAFGSFVGSVSGTGMARYVYPQSPASNVEASADVTREMKLELAELSTLKANLDTAARNTTSQFAKIADRLDRYDQHAAAADTTGTIPGTPAAASGPADTPKITDRILADWIVQDVQNGRALVQSRYGGIFDVGAGSVLPGVGRVDTIKRLDGQWVVLTARGTITSGH